MSMMANNSQDENEMDLDQISERDFNSSDNTDSESSDDSDVDGEELNEEECEKMKNDMTVDMTDLEKQFVALKEQLYYERLNRVDVKLTEVRAGKSIDYLQPLKELQENLQVRTEVAGVLHELRMENVKCIHEAEMVAAQQHLEAECWAIAEYIKQDLEEKLRRLEEDRNSIDCEAWNEASPNKRKKRFPLPGFDGGPIGRDQLNLPDRRRKPVSVSGPYIVYMLKESEILEDFNSLRKASRSMSNTSSVYF